MPATLRTCLLLLALAWPGMARAAWLEASSPHFVIYANASESAVRRFADKLERFHNALAIVTGVNADPPSPSNRVTVYVVGGEGDVQRVYGNGGRNIGGFYIPRADGSLAIVPEPSSAKDSGDFATIALLHEYVHHFMISASPTALPRWLSEGSAEFFATSSFDDDGTVTLGRPAQHRGAELAFAPDVKAAELLDEAAYDRHAQHGFDAYYGKAWLLYHYLTFASERKGQLGTYVRQLNVGKSEREAAVSAFGDLGKLERDIGQYLRLPRIHVLRVTVPALQPGAIAIRTLGPGEAAVMPVRIRSKRGVDSKTAQAVLVQARAVAARFPADAAVLCELAEAEHDAGNDQQSIAAADAALAIDPAQVNAYVQKGYSLFRIAEHAADKPAAYAQGRAVFVALNHREHDNPIPLIYFYRSYVEQDQPPPDLAIAGLVRAMELAPFDFPLRTTAAIALIHANRRDDARAALEPVAYDPHGGALADASRRLLAKLAADPAWDGHDAEAVLAKPAGQDPPDGSGAASPKP